MVKLSWAYKDFYIEMKKKILVVISDGAPVDDSTLSVNQGNYLKKIEKPYMKLKKTIMLN